MAGEQKLNFIYDENSAKPKEEDYLLGKSVDANYEKGTMGQINAVEYDCVPESIFSSKAEHQVDIQRKLQEDPLIELRKTEVETRKRILDNPLKMREIHSYIEKMKKKKSKKKKKKHSHSDLDDDEDLNALILKKMNKMRGDSDSDSEPKHSKKKRRSPSASPDRSRKDRRRERSRSKERHHKQRSRSRDRNRRQRSRSKDRYNRHRSRSKEPERRRQRSRSRERSKRRDERSPPPPRKNAKDHRSSAKSSSKLSDEERAKKLREMMSNADWRDEQRTKNVKKYREEEKEEEDQHYSRDHDPEFVRKQLIKAASSGTVESRIQSNKHNIQRSGMAMDKNFAKR